MTSNTNVDTTLEPVNSFFMQHRAATTDTMLGDAAMVSVANRSYSLCVWGGGELLALLLTNLNSVIVSLRLVTKDREPNLKK